MLKVDNKKHQSDVSVIVLVFLLLTMNIFHTLFNDDFEHLQHFSSVLKLTFIQPAFVWLNVIMETPGQCGEYVQS